jgi:hypothetical protein
MAVVTPSRVETSNETNHFNHSLANGKDVLNTNAIYKIAKQCLGQGYDRVNKKTLNQAFENFSNDDINIDHYKTFDEGASGIDKETAISKLIRKIGFNASLNFKVSAHPSLKYEKFSETTEETNKLVYASSFIHYVKFSFKNTPKPKDNMDPELIGDAYVKSGWAYAGYTITLELSDRNHKEKNNNHFSTGVNFDIFKIALGLSFDKETDSLKDKKFKNITFEAKGMGSYSVPTEYLSDDMNLIKEALTKIKKDFLEKLPYIQYLQQCIEDDDVTPYRIPKPKPDFLSFKLPTLLDMEEIPQWPIGTWDGDLTILATKIEAMFSEESKQKLLENSLGDIELDFIFDSMMKVFSENFKNTKDQTSDTMVLGKSGAGKSLLIGYLLGNKVIEPETQLNHSRKLQFAKDEEHCPIIGSGVSVTKGCRTFKKYIDTAGFLDTGGSSFDLCNAAAIHMTTQVCSPKNLILVISPNVFDERGQEFLGLIKNLQKFLYNANDKSVLSSILLLINDKKNPIKPTVNLIVNQINDAINILQTEQKNLLGESKYNQLISYVSSFFFKKNESKIKELLLQLPEKRRDKYFEYQNSVNILKTIIGIDDGIEEETVTNPNKKPNIIVADFLTNETRKKIKEWEESISSRSLSRESFNMYSLVENGYSKFKYALNLGVLYFDGLLREKERVNNLLKRTEELIEECENHIRTLNNPTGIMPSKDYVDIKEKLLKKLGTIEESLGKYKKQRDYNIKEIDRLQKSTELKVLAELKTSEPITYRYWFVFFDSWAKKYTFNYSGSPFPIKMEKKENNKIESSVAKKEDNIDIIIEKSKSPGKFFDENDSKLCEGKYTVKYLPTWCHNLEDCKASVTLKVKEMNHPNTPVRINALYEELGDETVCHSIKYQVINLENEINDLKKEINSVNECINNSKTKESYIENISNNLKKLQDKKMQYSKALIGIDSNLNPYKEFCTVLGQTAHEFCHTSSIEVLDAKEKEIFDSFYLRTKAMSKNKETENS